MLQLSLGKTPARAREADQLAGTAGDGGNKDGPGPDAVMEKPIGAPRRGRGRQGGAARAQQPCHLRRPARAGLLSDPAPERSSRAEGRPGKTENARREGEARGPRTRSALAPGAARQPASQHTPCSRPGRESGEAGARRVHAALRTATSQLRQRLMAGP